MFALEACGKCKFRQGGATTMFANITFAGDSGVPGIAKWSWDFQGIFTDMDGTLIGNRLCSAWPSLCPNGPTPAGLPGAAIVANDSTLLQAECVSKLSGILNVNGAVCMPGECKAKDR